MTRAVSLLLVAALLGGCSESGTPSGEFAARIDAELLLAAFVPPPGATRLDRMPAALAGTDYARGLESGGPILVADGWWQVKGDPGQVVGPIWAAPPPGSTLTGHSEGPAGAAGFTFSWPDDGLLRDRRLQVGAVALDPYTVLHVVATVTYADPKPPAAVIGWWTAKVAVVSLRLRSGGGPDPVTVTDPAKVARLAAIIDAAEPEANVVRFCGKDTGSGLTVVFRATVAGPDVATAVIRSGGCGGITVTTPGLPAGVGLEGGPEQIDEVIEILGLPWSVDS